MGLIYHQTILDFNGNSQSGTKSARMNFSIENKDKISASHKENYLVNYPAETLLIFPAECVTQM